MNGTPGPMAQWLEHAWLERYLARELDEGEVEWFESYMLDKPHLVAMVEADADLRDGMAAGPSAALQGRKPAASSRRLIAPMALAASVALGIAIGWTVAGTQGTATPLIMAGPTRVLFDTLRGTASKPQVYPGSAQNPYLLVEVGMPPDAADVRLLTDGIEMPLPVSSDGFASFLWQRDAPASGVPVITFTSAGESLRLELPLDSSILEMTQ